MKKTLSILLLSTALLSGLISCKKNNSNPQQCTLSSLTDSTTSVLAVTQFTYDAQNRLTEALVTGQKGCRRTFTYTGNMVIFNVTDTTPGILAETDSIMLNSKGLIQTQATHYTSSGTSSTETYFYDDAGTAISSIEISTGEPNDTLQYNTTNGDLMYEAKKGSAAHKTDFSYYPSQSIVYGDPTDFRQLLYYGAYYYKNMHMLSVISSPGTSYRSYAYTYSNNRIATATSRQWTSASADTVTHIISYKYTCK